MIEIKVLMNSSIEEVLSFKCCNLHDQNMEIHLRNNGQETVTLQGSCSLVNKEDQYRIDCLFPGGPYTIPPGEVVACYCTMLDEVFGRYSGIVFKDTEGQEYRAPLKP